MKMQQGQIIKAYNATETIKDNNDLPEATLWELFQLRKKFAPHVEFQQERERSLQEKYMKFADANGSISGEPYLNYIKDVQEIASLEKEIDWEPIELSLIPGLTLSTMEALDEFITFKKPE